MYASLDRSHDFSLICAIQGDLIPSGTDKAIKYFLEGENIDYLLSFIRIAKRQRINNEGREQETRQECIFGAEILTGIIWQASGTTTESVAAMKKWQSKIASGGGVEFVVDLFSDEYLMRSCWALLMAMLEGGNSVVQSELKNQLDFSANASSFVKTIRDQVQRCSSDLAVSTQRTLLNRENEIAIGEVSQEGIDNKQASQLLSANDEDTFSWLWCVLRGLQLFVEGDDKMLQSYLRGHRASGARSVNFIAELTLELQEVYTNIQIGSEWLEIITQYLSALTEMCQGNYVNQQVK